MSKDTAAGGKGPENEVEEEEFVAVEVDDKNQPIVQDSPDTGDDPDPDDPDAVDDDPSDDDDERVGHAEGEDEGAHAGETVEEKRERRRRENRTKRIRNRVAAEAKDRLIENQGRMLLNLQEQVAGLQGRSIQYDVNLLQSQISQIESQQQDAKAVLAKLSKAQDHEGIAEVVEVQMNLRDQHRTLSEQLRRAQTQAKGKRPGNGADADDAGDEPRGQPRQQRPDPEVVRRAQQWAAQHKWAHPRSGDPEEVAIMRSIDEVLSREGWDPRSAEYWTELTNRAKRRLPHHFKKAAPNGGGNNGGRPVNGSKPASGGPRMAPASQGGGQRPLGKNEVRVTPARKEAMKAAGKWDDPVKRNRQLAAYAKYDKEQAGEQ